MQKYELALTSGVSESSRTRPEPCSEAQTIEFPRFAVDMGQPSDATDHAASPLLHPASEACTGDDEGGLRRDPHAGSAREEALACRWVARLGACLSGGAAVAAALHPKDSEILISF